MAEEKLNLIQKLAQIRSIADVVSKDKKGYNYTYADITSILAKITAGMKKYGVSLIPQIVAQTANVSQNIVKNTKFDRSGKPYENTTTEMLVSADMVFKWVNDEDPDDYIEVPWFVTGSQSDPSQAFGSGLTYCTRYFLTNYFQIAQADDDVDAYRSKQKEAEVSEERAISEEIIKKFDTVLRDYLEKHNEKSDEVKKFICKYVKDAKYPSIKDPHIASKLLEDFTNTYLKADK